jgi:uncharacterized membrane protein
MDKETASVGLVLLTALLVFAAVQPVLPSNVQPFSEIGILGPDQTIGQYPTSVSAGDPFLLYGYIGNHQAIASLYKFVVKVGNQSTIVSNSTSSLAPVIFTYSHVLANNQSVVFPVSLALSQPAINQRLIFELWTYDVASSSYVYTGLWDQLFLNVTSG